MNSHHLILGRLVDYLDGRVLDDTLDERYCQKVAHLLVERKGYVKAEIAARRLISIRAGEKVAQVPAAFTVTLDDAIAMLIHYGPGSLVTRHRPALAMSRLLGPCQVPVVVVTNGEQADILDGRSGKRLAEGLVCIPSREQLMAIADTIGRQTISPERAEKEARVLMAFEVDDRCSCDTSVTRCASSAE